MDDVEERTKKLAVGIGTVVALGVVTYLCTSDDVQGRMEAMINRRKAKCFVRDTLKGNKKAMSVIDNLSDTEITHLLNTIDKVGAMEDKLSDYSEQLKNITSDLKDTFLDKTNTLKNKIHK